MSARASFHRRGAFVAVAVVLGGCAEIEGLGRFSAVETDPPLSPALDEPEAGSTSGGGSDEDVQTVPPPLDGEAGIVDAASGDAADASPRQDAAPPPPPPVNVALGAIVDAAPAAPMGDLASNLVDGHLTTSWSPGAVCGGTGSNTAGSYDCAAPGVSIHLLFETAPTVGRIVVRPPAGAASTGIVTATLIIGEGVFQEALTFPATGDATFTFPPVAAAFQLTIQILTASVPDPTIGEIEVYGS